jgi:hypothetical protein
VCVCVCVCVSGGSSVVIDEPSSNPNIKYHFFKTFEIDYLHT